MRYIASLFMLLTFFAATEVKAELALTICNKGTADLWYVTDYDNYTVGWYELRKNGCNTHNIGQSSMYRSYMYFALAQRDHSEKLRPVIYKYRGASGDKEKFFVCADITKEFKYKNTGKGKKCSNGYISMPISFGGSDYRTSDYLAITNNIKTRPEAISEYQLILDEELNKAVIPDGIGKDYWDDNGISYLYYGSYKNGRPNGKGVLQENRDADTGIHSTYEGNFVDGVFQDGEGIITKVNPAISNHNFSHYEGEILNGKPHGKGALRTRDFKKCLAFKNFYVGDFLNGLPHGNGLQWEKKTCPEFGRISFDRTKYKGSFIKGLRNGKFKVTKERYYYELSRDNELLSDTIVEYVNGVPKK